MDAVVANSREMIRLGSRSFALAAKLFDADTRHHAYMLYAWCRYCDDEIDGQNLGMQPGPESARDSLAAVWAAGRMIRRRGWNACGRRRAGPLPVKVFQSRSSSACSGSARNARFPSGMRWSCWPDSKWM